MQDSITILTSRGPLLTKKWLDGNEIEGHGKAKHHGCESFKVDNIRDLADVLGRLAKMPTSGVIRGEFIGHEAAALVPDPDGERKGKLILRQAKYFTDPAHHWIMFDLDNYVPVKANPDTDPVAAIEEWIATYLPPEFIGVTYYWQLSSSAGHPTKKGSLRAHLWFFIDRAMTSPEAHAWVTMTKLPIDRAPLNVVQLHYTADPVMAPGVVDPIAVRGGLEEGFIEDVVRLQLDRGALAVAMLESRKGIDAATGAGAECADPRLKTGLVGAFCRAFSVEDVLQAEWFLGAFEQVNNRRFTWLDGNGAAEGAYLTEDGMRFVSTHNTAPADSIGKGLNAYDLARVYNFGALDDAVPEEDRWSWTDPKNRPSEAEMRKFARSLPEVQAEMDNGPDDGSDNPFEFSCEDEPAQAPGGDGGEPPAPPEKKVKTDDAKRGAEMHQEVERRLFAMSVTEDEIKAVVDTAVLAAAWKGCFYSAGQGKLYLLNKADGLVQFAFTDWTRQVKKTFGQFLAREALTPICKRLAEVTSTPARDVEESLRKAVAEVFFDNVKCYRQKGDLSFHVDPFASKSSIEMVGDTTARITYTMGAFPRKRTGLTAEAEAAIVAEYKGFFKEFDALVQLVLHARFATDRRLAFLWLNCPAGWGKGLLFDGVFGRDGLDIFTEVALKEIERAFEGAPTGFQASDIVGKWGLLVDEMKTVKSEVKQLNNHIMASPKNQLRFMVEVYTKVFMSAEDVDALAGLHGVEAQFAQRFALIRQRKGSTVDALPLFKQHGKLIYRTVLANYAGEILNAGIARMRDLGRAAASKVADEWLTQFHADQGIEKEHAVLGENLGELVADLKALLLDWGRASIGQPTEKGNRVSHLPGDLKMQLDQCTEVIHGGRHRSEAADSPERLLLVSSPQTLIKVWIDVTVDRSERVSLSNKTREIAELLCGEGDSDEGAKNLKNGVRCYANVDGVLTPKKTKGQVFQLLDAGKVAVQVKPVVPGDNVVYPDFNTIEDVGF